MSDTLAGLDGLFVGQLDQDETRLLDDACAQGLARYSYEGAAGFMGLARVRLTNKSEQVSREQNVSDDARKP
jgi:hypothetical protein